MNRLFPQQIFIASRAFSNATGDAYLTGLQDEIAKLKEDLIKEQDFFDLHTKYLNENKAKYNTCLTDWVGNNSGPYAGFTKATCDAQILPTVGIEEKKVADSQIRINGINGEILNKENRILTYLREKAKSDPEALAMLQKIEGEKNSSSMKKTYIIAGSLLLAAIVIGVIVYKVRKAKKTA